MTDQPSSPPETAPGAGDAEAGLQVRAERDLVIGGDLVARDKIITNIQNIVQRALTATEEAEQAHTLEAKRLAQGVAAFLQNLRARASDAPDTRSVNPYKGLLEYRLSDAELFFRPIESDPRSAGATAARPADRPALRVRRRQDLPAPGRTLAPAHRRRLSARLPSEGRSACARCSAPTPNRPMGRSTPRCRASSRCALSAATSGRCTRSLSRRMVGSC